eukprot:scaffold308470_cov34-Prasinocladus_malaysianus.AAC.1
MNLRTGGLVLGSFNSEIVQDEGTFSNLSVPAAALVKCYYYGTIYSATSYKVYGVQTAVSAPWDGNFLMNMSSSRRDHNSN